MSRRGWYTNSCFIIIPGKTSFYVLEGIVHYFMLHHYSRERLHYMSRRGRYTTSYLIIIPGQTSLYVLEGTVRYFMLHHYSRTDFIICLRWDGTLLHASSLFQVRPHYMSRRRWYTTSCFIIIPGKTLVYVSEGMVHYLMLNHYSR